MSRASKLGTGSGVGLVVSNMIGAGVFLSAGFMAQDLTPGQILLAWVVGALIALSGARAYAAVAELVPRSGGEYRYLSDLVHPFLGCMAGWASLLVGFAAPVAIDAISAGAFARTLGGPGDPRLLGTGLVLVLTGLHSLHLRSSKWTQNSLVFVNATLLLGFVLLGLLGGHNSWPTWTPPQAHAGFPWAPFMGSLFFIAFAFSGWNATVYAAEDFEEPTRDVPRAMLIGCAIVAVLYLLVNWVFVANLTPERARVVFDYETTRVTLGHVIATDLAGEWGGRLMSVLAIVAFVSAMSAMIFAGPRLYAAMARDGFLPEVLAGAEGRPPLGSILLQGALALLIIWTHTLQDALKNVGAILTVFTALTAAALIKVYLSPGGRKAPPIVAVAAAGVSVASALWMLYFGFQGKLFLAWLGGILACSAASYVLAPRRRVLRPAASS
jgi:APA family basic amino acid/polyamine antiporter